MAICPHMIDLPARMMKDTVERNLLIHPEDGSIQDISRGCLRW